MCRRRGSRRKRRLREVRVLSSECCQCACVLQLDRCIKIHIGAEERVGQLEVGDEHAVLEDGGTDAGAQCHHEFKADAIDDG